MVIRISDKTQNYSKVTKLLVKPLFYQFQAVSKLTAKIVFDTI